MRILSFLVVVLIATTSVAQNISGKAYYESKTTVDMDNFGNREMSEQMKKTIADRMKSMLEKTYILTFNKNESVYKEEEKLDAAGGGRGFGMMMNSFSAGVQYKNLEKNQILEEREFFGKQFLINDTITNLQWTVTDEKKMIGQYLAVKATAIKQIDENDFSMARRRNRDDNKKKDDTKEEKTTGDDTLKKDGDTANAEEKKDNDPMDDIEVPKEIEVTAWFTPQIPVSNGPGEYAGLPGLILEMNMHRTTILCSKIVLSTKAGEKIEAPDKGDEVTREEYNKVVKEKMDEMRENFRGSGGRRGGGRRGGF